MFKSLLIGTCENDKNSCDLSLVDLLQQVGGGGDIEFLVNTDDEDGKEENVLSNEVNDIENSEGELILSNVSLEEALKFFTK